MADPSGKRRAVVLLSGGLDSATAIAIAASEGREITALTFDYGQRHSAEIEASRRIAADFGAYRHSIVRIDLRAFGGSALTDDIDVPKGRDTSDIGDGIPVTYVPARNTIFLANALALAEVEDAAEILIGVNALDYSGYPDCRPAFIAAFQALTDLATKAGVEGTGRVTVRTPLIAMTKAEIISTGTELGVEFARTLSCYDPVYDDSSAVVRHCGACDACILRKHGFLEAGITDPTSYA